MQSSMRYALTRPPRAASSDPRSVDPPRPRRPTQRRFLRKSDLEDKLLITRTTGRQFGIVGEAWVEPRRLSVQSFEVTTKTPLLKKELTGTVPLKSIREVGDVVLIHAEQDVRSERMSERLNQMTVPGLKLILDNGMVIGRCVDFVFDPETGRILKFVFHTVNLPFANQSWFDQYAVSVQSISRIVLSEKVVYLKDDASWNKIAVGQYQFLANLIPSFDRDGGTGDKAAERMDWGDVQETAELKKQYQKLLEESSRQQEAYYAKYGAQPTKPPQRRRVSQLPPGRARAPPPRRETTRIDEWLEKEQRKEELFMQE